jgi:hypothetical protein
MKLPYFILLLSLLVTRLHAQNNVIEISGTITGTYNSKMYLFFDGEARLKDSSPITDGKFYFKLNRQGPVLARLHLGQKSLLRDVYVEGAKMELSCTSNCSRLYKTTRAVKQAPTSLVKPFACRLKNWKP